MKEKEKKAILEKSKEWFKQTIIENHRKNAQKLVSINEFNVNPFLATYLAYFLTGNAKPESIAKALIYPRILGTSINTSFGTNIQKFTTEVLSSYASTTSGIDIEFDDEIDKTHKYCQLKAGPNTINKDDVETIANHFKGIKNLARTNGLKIAIDDLIVGVIYGTERELSGHYKRIISQYDYPVIVGKDFWYHLTGDDNFYKDLIISMGSAVQESDYSKELQEIIKQLSKAKEIIEISE